MPLVATSQPSAGTGIAAALHRHGVVDVATDETAQAMYSSDASVYRVRPCAVVRPRDVDDVAATLEVCRTFGVPMTARGGGTSIAGNAIGRGVVLDFSRHLDQILEIDPAARTARLAPGVIPSDLQRELSPHNLHFGPDPSSHSRCTIGGMIGNNACGARTLAYGRTSDNIVALEAITASGDVMSIRTGLHGDATTHGCAAQIEALSATVAGNLATIRTEFGRLKRQVSGYALEHLLPENGFDVGRFLVGSEGTLAVVTEAIVHLSTAAEHRTLVVMGFPDIGSAGVATSAVVPHGPTACEGLDGRIIDVIRQRLGAAAVPPLPEGGAWLFVELSGDDPRLLVERARRLLDDVGPGDAVVVADPSQVAALWRIREDGAGLAGRSPAGHPAYAGWEDAAVPPERVGEYLRSFNALLDAHGLTAIPYGHFADGCVHARIDFPFGHADGAARYRRFVKEAAELVAGMGGTLSGEHGDGRARSELLGAMYSPGALAIFAAVKQAFDPDNVLNPGVLVDPEPFDAHLRVTPVAAMHRQLAFAYSTDQGDFHQAVHRCTGIGRCRADNAAADGVMCPSYLATRDERDSTRGRARVLQELASGHLRKGWKSAAIDEVLDLCLACKGCASDCPTGVDMATYKAEALHQRYRRRVRPRVHYALGWLPRWARLASRLPKTTDALLNAPGLSTLMLAAAGVDRRREVPRFATQTLQDWVAASAEPLDSGGRPVMVFVDSFTNYFTPEVGQAMFGVLREAGYSPRPTPPGLCCGLTWISTGQLTAARRILSRTVRSLESFARNGIPIVGIEPSCTAVLRGDARELLASAEADVVASATHTLAELLAGAPDWRPPDLSGHEIVAQPHCHHHAVLGWAPDQALLSRTGAQVRRLERLLRTRRQLRRRSRSLRRLGCDRRDPAVARLARVSDRDNPHRRLFVSDPARRSRRSPRNPSCPVAGTDSRCNSQPVVTHSSCKTTDCCPPLTGPLAL